MRGVRLIALAATLGALSGCRDATEPFRPVEGPIGPGAPPLQVTFSAGEDRSPTWNAAGDTILYATEGFPPFPELPGLILRLPALGGRAEMVVPELQSTGLRRWLATPVPSPDGGRLAYVEMWSVPGPELCVAVAVQCTPPGSDPVAPRLEEVRLRVREAGTPPSNTDDVTLRVGFQGREFVTSTQNPFLPGFFRIRYHPFHQFFQGEGSLVFRPSWAPDGRRLVLSDGLRLLVWEVGDPAGTPLPGTEDGVLPAWAPDGSWIAFTRLIRGDSLVASCTHSGVLGPSCQQERVVFPVAGRRLVLVRPDGSEIRDLGPGSDPAWLPDSRALVYRDAGRLQIRAVDGTLLGDIPGTEDAREPAVSPDGTLVVFSRRSPGGTHDLWITTLPGGGS